MTEVFPFGWDQRVSVKDGEPSEPVIIVARNLRFAKAWCELYNVNPASRRIKYVTNDVTRLYGTQGAYCVDLGTDSAEIREYLERLKVLGAVEMLHKT